MDTNDLPKSFTFRALYKELGKPKHIFNFKKFEGYFSIICSIILVIICYKFINSNIDNNIDYIISTIQNMILYAIAGLLTMLGFVVSGLAIISGTIGYKVTHQMVLENNFKKLLSILFSFFYIGFIIGILIVSCVCCYFIIGINIQFNMSVFLVLSFILFYGLFFTIFYAVSLLGTCISMFTINYFYSTANETKDGEIVEEAAIKNDFNIIVSDIRFNTMLNTLLSKKIVKENEFIDGLSKRIDEDCPEEYKEEVREFFKEVYKLDRDI
ncbi:MULTISPECIES: hypothetical protein [Bacillus]|uniref:hypothetical protein n=1 Tax=Bacillus TaxID=1386 RepID=UPI00073AE0BF|nr:MULTISPECIES: hypothetical protein [Bacillus]ALV03921.1 hypothetical protein AVM03_16860 [Bacillus amyloliquefaciens]UFH23255.1 hypothetical protein LOK79_03190 [Bacillus velezensis]UUT17888.1 hypothetical protein NRF13_03285 [Bacillus velezensis]BET16612.1 hypothetical protein RBIBE_06020 [Bacillus velezensis]